ncbi:hypothetical protein KA478_03425 [Patescibacteria group bacterium]|nr:hypothetical protein [Patescibacteria group bacterium]
MNTIWTKDYESSKSAAILQEYSAKKYGRKKEYVEAEIQARLGVLEEVPAEQPAPAEQAAPVEQATPSQSPAPEATAAPAQPLETATQPHDGTA